MKNWVVYIENREKEEKEEISRQRRTGGHI
jgi:hypothetical protein